MELNLLLKKSECRSILFPFIEVFIVISVTPLCAEVEEMNVSKKIHTINKFSDVPNGEMGHISSLNCYAYRPSIIVV